MKYRDDSNHLFVVYNQLVNETEAVLRAVTNFLDLEYEEAMIKDFHQTAGSLTKEEEEWKDKNHKQSLSRSNKLQTHFDDSTIAYIKRYTRDIDLTSFYQ